MLTDAEVDKRKKKNTGSEQKNGWRLEMDNDREKRAEKENNLLKQSISKKSRTKLSKKCMSTESSIGRTGSCQPGKTKS